MSVDDRGDLALALGPIAVGQAAVVAGQSVAQGAAGQTVTQPGQCVAPGLSVACAPAQPVTTPAMALPASPALLPTSNNCAGLNNQVDRAMDVLRRLRASPRHSRSYAHMLSKAKQEYAAAQQAAAADACRRGDDGGGAAQTPA